MNHLNHIEILYRKKLLNKLNDLDILTYQNKFKNPIKSWDDCLNKADFDFTYNGNKKEIKVKFLDFVWNKLSADNLIIWDVITLIIPMFYISLDGTFALKLRKLIDLFINTYLIKNNSEPLSYFILFDRSDVWIQARVYCCEHLINFSLNDSSNFLNGLKEKIKAGYFRNDPWASEELETRVSFWKSLKLVDVQVDFDSPGYQIGRELPGVNYYGSYLEMKKGFYPNADEVYELTTIHYNKLLPDILLLMYEWRERMYNAETLEDIYSLYIGLGLCDVRFIGSGVFEIHDKKNFCDIILTKEKWKDLETSKFDKWMFLSYLPLDNWLGCAIFLRTKDIESIINDPLKHSLEEKLRLITKFNIIMDPTMDVRPKYRHPVTYDYFTTPRVIPYTTKENELELCVPLVELTDETKYVIQEKATEWGYVLTENKEEDEYFRYKEFYIKTYHAVMKENLKDPIYLAEKRSDIQEAIRLINERAKTRDPEAFRQELYNSSKREGIRRNLNLKEDETIR